MEDVCLLLEICLILSGEVGLHCHIVRLFLGFFYFHYHFVFFRSRLHAGKIRRLLLDMATLIVGEGFTSFKLPAIETITSLERREVASSERN